MYKFGNRQLSLRMYPNTQLSLGVWAFVKNAFTVNFAINSQNKPNTDTGHPFQQLSI